MTNYEDLTGQKFGRLTVIERVYDYKGKSKGVYWLCRCECGGTTITTKYQLKSKRCQSCGCLSRDLAREKHLKHGGSNERLYVVWKNMRKRCSNPNTKEYKNYGGRGIKVCSEWDDYSKFKEFMLSKGYDPEAPKGQCTIERIDVNGDYCPENCTIKTNKEQAFNKRVNHRMTYKGETLTVTEFAEKYHINKQTLFDRVNTQNLSPKEAIERKVVTNGYYGNPTKYTTNGETHTCREWSEILGVKFKTLTNRLSINNHDIFEAIIFYKPEYLKNLSSEEMLKKEQLLKEFKRRGRIYFLGREGHTCREWSEILGVKFKTLNNWLREHNFDIYKAVLKYKPSYLKELKF